MSHMQQSTFLKAMKVGIITQAKATWRPFMLRHKKREGFSLARKRSEMAHATSSNSYHHLIDRINRFPQGAPASDLLFGILKMLYTEKEAEYVSLLPIRPFTVKKAARIWKKSEPETHTILDSLAGRGLLLDIELNSRPLYVMPPPMAGFFEFSLMRIRKDLDQKKLAELFYQYLNVEEDFIKDLFTVGETRLGRVFVHEPEIPPDLALYVLDYERSSYIIETAGHISVSLCYCRHKMQHNNRACNAPLDICLTLNQTGASLAKHGIGRTVDAAQALDLLQQAYEHNLVQFGENVREQVNFICNCCGCCCEALLAAKRFGHLKPVHTTNFLPEIDIAQCDGCGRCVEKCPVQAISLVSAGDPHHKKKMQARIQTDACLGCGICARNCPQSRIKLVQRPGRVITPLNTAHNSVIMAIEKGCLHHFIFDSQALWSHRAMAAILGVILKAPPLKQALAQQQIKSRYIEFIISKTWLTEKNTPTHC
jgi:ferredoxin